ncbi:unnamed protein product [Cladocopium goreaui]|uniref:RWD domain-containing protein n=1 Tax=Cladocopium goreaui TaxID=2562237 RepID=A0A9P1BMQ8_9DINO|nr:unnamed protein product [Cladocopium goreaui]
MPDPVKIKGTATRSELLKVFQRWDHLHRLYVCKSSEVSEEDRCELFAVAKDVDKDRQILHRKRRNLREKHVPGASRDLPHGVLLCQLPLESSHVVACSVDDVKDFYHAYEATEARAKSSPVGPRFQFREVAHLNACQAALAEGRIRPTDSLEAFQEADKAYEAVGLQAHPKKKQRRTFHTQVLGAEIEGEQGLVGPSRGRLLQLARISAEVAVLGIGDEKIVEALTGLWAYCAQYRRPMFRYHRMPLLSRLGAALKGAGWDEDAVHDFLSEGEDPREDGGFPPISGLEASKDWIQLFLQKAVAQGWSPGFPQQLEEASFDFLEMYSGRADMSRAWKEQGFRVLPPLDLRQGSLSRHGFGACGSSQLPPLIFWRIWKADLGLMRVGLCWLAVFCWLSVAIAPRPSAGARNRDQLLRGRITEKTRVFRQDLLHKLVQWLTPHLGECSLDTLARKHIDILSEYLEEYILHLYVSGQSRLAAAETLNAIVQTYGWLRPSLAGPWGLIRSWEHQEPPTHNPPIPVQVLRALVACALAWHWPKLAVTLALGFFALLRPAECIGLRRQDLALPEDHLEGDVLYVRIGAPKTRFRTSQNQHVRVDEPGLAHWIAWILRYTPMWQRIWRGSLSSFSELDTRLP